jgi:single-strand DNA-binding protein
MQSWIAIGNLTRDPELRYSKNGTAVTKFSIAVNYKQGDKDAVDYFNIVAWAKLAEVVAEYVRKGHKVCVTGEMHQNDWEKEDGTKVRSFEVTARNVEFLNSPQKREEAPIDERNAPRQSQSRERPQAHDSFGAAEPGDDPFGDLAF